MTENPPSTTAGTLLRWPLLACIVVSGLLFYVVFLLGYEFPPSGPAVSASALLGFNNDLAYRFYAPFCLILSLLLPAVLPRQPTSPSLKLEGPPWGRIPSKAFFVTLAIQGVVFAGLYFWKRGFVFAEALYHQESAYRIFAGKAFLTEMSFIYGPAMIYPVVILSEWMRLQAAYGVVFMATLGLALYALYIAVRVFHDDQKDADFWFVLLSFGYLMPDAGLNYTFLRFILPGMALIFAWRYYHRPSLSGLGVSIAVSALALLYSFEISLVTLASVGLMSALWHFLGGRTDWPKTRTQGALLSGAMFLFIAAFFAIDPSFKSLLRYTGTFKAVRGGGWNVPVFPCLPMLSLITASLLVGAAVARDCLRNSLSPTTVFLVSYAAMMMLLQRAGFGASDAGHIAWNGLPTFVAATWAGQRFWPGLASRNLMAALLVVGLFIPFQFSNVARFAPAVAHRLSSSRPAGGGVRSPRTVQEPLSIEQSIRAIIAQLGEGRKYYFHDLGSHALSAMTAYSLRPVLYYADASGAFYSEESQASIAEMREQGIIIIADERSLRPATVSEDLSRFEWLYLAMGVTSGGNIYRGSLNAALSQRKEPLRRFFQSECKVIARAGDLVALAPPSAAP